MAIINPYLNSQFNRERLKRQRDEIDYMLNSIDNNQNVPPNPVNNFINTQPQMTNVSSNTTYTMKILNDNDEVENIFVDDNTIFIGTNKMQIKKLDGTIEKYEIKKYYPVDIKDQKIDELTKKIEELERRLGNEPSKSDESIVDVNQSITNDDVPTKSKSSSNRK